MKQDTYYNGGGVSRRFFSLMDREKDFAIFKGRATELETAIHTNGVSRSPRQRRLVDAWEQLGRPFTDK